MEISKLATVVLSLGFSCGDQVRDFGYPITGCRYLYRETQKGHEYLSILGYSPLFVGKTPEELARLDATFIGAVLELYHAPKSRGKIGNRKLEELQAAGLAPVSVSLIRDVDDMMQAISV